MKKAFGYKELRSKDPSFALYSSSIEENMVEPLYVVWHEHYLASYPWSYLSKAADQKGAYNYKKNTLNNKSKDICSFSCSCLLVKEHRFPCIQTQPTWLPAICTFKNICALPLTRMNNYFSTKNKIVRLIK